jgi:hypothetical protein
MYQISTKAEHACSCMATEPSFDFIGSPCCPTLNLIYGFLEGIVSTFYTLLMSFDIIEICFMYEYLTLENLCILSVKNVRF